MVSFRYAVVRMDGSNWRSPSQFVPFPQTCPYADWDTCNHNQWHASGYLSVRINASALQAT